MSSSSFYTGPDRPLLRINRWEDLVAAVQAGALTETQWVELKAALPAAASKANLELARDLASLTVDGGALLIGVKDPGSSAEDLVGTDDPLEALKSRVDQVAGSTRIQPPLHLQLTAVQHPNDATRHLLLVAVPASPEAPHMVDGRYWGRSATGKRPLTDSEASRLMAGRRGSRDDFAQRVSAAPPELAHLWPQERRLGWAQILVEPAVARIGGALTDAVGDQHPLQLVSAAVGFSANWHPNLMDLRYSLAHPDGLSAASFDLADPQEERYRMHALLRDDGAVRVLGPALSPYGADGTVCISVNHHVELMHQVLQLASHLARTYLGYAGAWNAGVHLEGLAGQASAQALRNDFGGWHATPFQTGNYSRTATVSSSQLGDGIPAVVEQLLKDLARGLGLQRRMFPYTDSAQIRQRG